MPIVSEKAETIDLWESPSTFKVPPLRREWILSKSMQQSEIQPVVSASSLRQRPGDPFKWCEQWSS